MVGMLAIVRLRDCVPALPIPLAALQLPLSLSLAVEDRSLMLAALFIERGAIAASETIDADVDNKSFLEDTTPKNDLGRSCAIELPPAKNRISQEYVLNFTADAD